MILAAIAGAAVVFRLRFLALGGATLWRRELHPVRGDRGVRLGHVAGLVDVRLRASPLYLGMAAQPFRALRDDADPEAGDPASR